MPSWTVRLKLRLPQTRAPTDTASRQSFTPVGCIKDEHHALGVLPDLIPGSADLDEGDELVVLEQPVAMLVGRSKVDYHNNGSSGRALFQKLLDPDKGAVGSADGYLIAWLCAIDLGCMTGQHGCAWSMLWPCDTHLDIAFSLE